MKKLAVFLILFVFSMPAFAQDASLFTENFSLVRDLEANSNGFFNSNILCPGNYLFFGGNERHSRQHQPFQMFRSQQSSDCRLLLRIAAVEDGRQNWGNRHDFIYGRLYGQKENTSSEEKSESLAEGYLRRLAERSKKSRKIGGTAAIVIGGGLIVAGASLTSKEPEGWFDFRPVFGYLSIITGAGCVVGGSLALAIPSGAERKLKDVLSISDPGHRERASHEALSSLAARGRRNRILSAILSAGFSGLALFSDEGNALAAAEFGALAVYNLMRKSRAERAFQNYLMEKKSRNKLEFSLGVMPYGGVKIGFVYSF
jgi:hypothetical protein